MKPNHALIALLAVLALFSCLLAFLDAQGIAEPKSVQIGSTLVFSALTFSWFWLDSEARSYKRSPLLSIAVVARIHCSALLLASKSPQGRAAQGV